jgi:hypothetical protein
LIYYCDQIILEDKGQFYYTISPYELKNGLGNIAAVLQEYTFTNKSGIEGQFFCKLYKTKEGNWYDFEETKMIPEKEILRMLKSAIDTKETKTVFG